MGRLVRERLRRTVVLLLLLTIVSAGVPARAGAWTVERGSLYSRLSASYLTSDTEYDEDGDEEPFAIEGEFADSTVALYAEYGLLDGLTLIGSLPFKTLRYVNIAETGEARGIADVEVGLRWRLLRAPVVLAVQGLAKVPGAYDGNDRLPLGNDQFDSDLRLMLGQSLAAGRMYYGAEAAYRFRAEDPSDERRYLLELGLSPPGPIGLRFKYEIIDSVNNAADVRDVFGNPVATLSAERRGVESALSYAVSPRWAVEATYHPTVDGRSTAKSATYSLALVLLTP